MSISNFNYELDSKKIVKMFELGETQTSILKKFKISHTIVKLIMVENGIKSRTEIIKERHEQIKKSFLDGMSISDISEKYKTTESTVKKILKPYITTSDKGIKCKCPTCKLIYYSKGDYTGKGIWYRYCDNCGGKELSQNIYII